MPRKKNAAVDVLSHHVIALAVTILQTTLPDEIQRHLEKNDLFGAYLRDLQQGRIDRYLEGYTLEGDHLYFLKGVCVPASLLILDIKRCRKH